VEGHGDPGTASFPPALLFARRPEKGPTAYKGGYRLGWVGGPGPAIVVATLIGPLPYPSSIRNMPTPLSPNIVKGLCTHRPGLILYKKGRCSWVFRNSSFCSPSILYRERDHQDQASSADGLCPPSKQSGAPVVDRERAGSHFHCHGHRFGLSEIRTSTVAPHFPIDLFYRRPPPDV
jgi:hypothetical protein